MNQLSTNPIFMSYSRKDDTVMRRIAAFLRKQGNKVGVENEKLIPGTPVWEEEIEKAIKGAAAIVVILSPDAKHSEWVRREISLADQYRKRVFPVLVSGDEESSISLRLINRQYVDICKNENMGLGSLETALSVYLQELNPQESEIQTESLNAQNSSREISYSQINKVETQIGVLWGTLGWALGGLIGGYIYSEADTIFGGSIGGLVGGAIGGFIWSLISRTENISNNIIKPTLIWAIAGMIGWLIGWELIEGAVGAGIGIAIFAVIGIIGTLGFDYISSNSKSFGVITLAWGIGGALGWTIARDILIDSWYMEKSLSWGIGIAIGWAIGGYVMSRQMMKR